MSLSDLWAAIQTKWNIFDISIEDHLRKTGQDKLPQAKLLTGSVKALEDNLTEAYLRGSFSYGEADEHSDIDLFVVVPPEKLEETYDKFVEYLNENHSVLVFCHDRLVKDYGGIGFMFVVKDENDKLYQFDFYMAMKGVPPKTHLFDCPRVYSSEPEYCWLTENKPEDLPDVAQKFIDKHTCQSSDKSVSSELEYQMVDLMVTLNIMKKHLTRGQNTRALNDNNHSMGILIEMLRAIQKDKTVHTALYAGDKVIQKCKETGEHDAEARALEKAIFEPVSFQKVSDLYDIGTAIVKDADPALYNKLKPAIDEYERLVLDPMKQSMQAANQNSAPSGSVPATPPAP